MSNSQDLKKIREEQTKFLPETVYVQQLTRVPDGAGGWSEVWQTVSEVKGRIAQNVQRSDERVQGGSVRAQGEYIITLPFNAEVKQSDRLQISGVQYEVKAVLERSEKTALRIIAERI